MIKEFQCQTPTCREVFERRFQSYMFFKLSTVVCPKCGSRSIEVKISQTAPPVFKGEGFYATEYKK